MSALSRSIPRQRAFWGARMLSVVLLGCLAVGVGWVGWTGYWVFADSYVAPLNLSPNNDRVLQVKLRLNRHTSELARLEAELSRIDGEIAAIDQAIETLSKLSGAPRDSMTWAASVRAEQSQTIDQMVDNLRHQRKLLRRLHRRQSSLTEQARRDLEAGMIERTEMQRQEQALDSLALSLAENQRQLDEALMRHRDASLTSQAYRQGLGETVPADTDMPGGQLPDVAAGQEHEARLAIELIRLESERRGLQALRAPAVERLDTERRLLEELEARPLYRAIEASTDIAFVPYDELDSVAPDSRVVACVWGLFSCRDVGRVAEVLPGEVVSEDPWGELARGHYAILDLGDAEAIREKLLRVR